MALLPLMLSALGQCYVVLGGSINLSLGAIISLVNVVVVQLVTVWGGGIGAIQGAMLSGIALGVARGVSGAFASLAAFILLGYTGSVFVSAGEQHILPPVIAVEIGGTALAGGKGIFSGSAAGATFPTLLTAISPTPADRQVVFGVVLIAFMVLYGREKA